MIRLHKEHMEEIEQLEDITITIGTRVVGTRITVKFRVEPCMHDGKEVNTLVKDILR